jgi:hypothetical protein
MPVTKNVAVATIDLAGTSLVRALAGYESEDDTYLRDNRAIPQTMWLV